MPDPFDVFLSSPTVVSGTVYIGSGDQHVYALDARTGVLKWSFATGDVVHAAPAVANNTVYVGSWDRNLYALDGATGKEKWRLQGRHHHLQPDRTGQLAGGGGRDGLRGWPGRAVPCGQREDRRIGLEAQQPGRLDHRVTRSARRRGLFSHLRWHSLQGARCEDRRREVRFAE
jgi:hypothetical protein